MAKSPSKSKAKAKLSAAPRLIDAAAEELLAQHAYARAHAWALAPAGTPYNAQPEAKHGAI